MDITQILWYVIQKMRFNVVSLVYFKLLYLPYDYFATYYSTVYHQSFKPHYPFPPRKLLELLNFVEINIFSFDIVLD